MQYPIKTALTAGLVAGTLDAICATVIFSGFFHRGSPIRLWQGIASVLLGRSASTGGIATALFGLLMHYCIATSFAAFFIFLYPRLPFLRQQKIIAGLLYGIFVFLVMDVIILHLLGIAPPKFSLIPSLRSITVLMLAIGLPISLITSKYYRKSLM